eukprot:scpid41867/ scgid10685/ Alpha-protein kinase vwkA; von Willebrand factor A alpha-kinase
MAESLRDKKTAIGRRDSLRRSVLEAEQNGDEDSSSDESAATVLAGSEEVQCFPLARTRAAAGGATAAAVAATGVLANDRDSVTESPAASWLSCDFSTADLTRSGASVTSESQPESSLTSDVDSRCGPEMMESEDADTVLATSNGTVNRLSSRSTASGARRLAERTVLGDETVSDLDVHRSKTANSEASSDDAGTVLAQDLFQEVRGKQKVRKSSSAADGTSKPPALHVLGEQLSQAESVDVCFMVDCTESMGRWIVAVRNNIKTLYQRIQEIYNRQCHIRAAFVGYYDVENRWYKLERPSTKLDFTTSPTKFYSFVNKVHVGGGDDAAEDVMTGFEETFKLSWREGVTKLVIHIADQPCHGRIYHHGQVSDNYPSGDPWKRSHVDMMKVMARQNIQYYFGEITGHTGKMINVFNECLKRESYGRLSITTFDAISPEGEGFSTALLSAVRSSIIHSVSELRTPLETRPACREIDPTLPMHLERLPITAAVAMRFEMPASIDDDILRSTAMKLMKYDVTLRMAVKPFAQGCLRLAYHGLDVTKNKRVVLKRSRFTNPEHNRFKRYLEDMEMQAVTARFLADFKKALPATASAAAQKIEVLIAKVIKLQSAFCEEDRYMMMEPYLSGNYSKFSNNAYSQCAGSELERIMQAFSHWTYTRSRERMIVVDLQGSVHNGVTYLTDPAIHCTDAKRFGKTTNYGVQGMRMFFAGHECNRVCRSLNLTPVSVV